ncbi:hypothetical protein E2562_020088 [Oryza meyeriana var. granulata]|uniref:Uncharacterized protein n=1 Tax=Oryza meyeriana var. granulata TaxID=110450 RepID=A0A6G1EBG1_9ORYZ|nr:hypothetical protein E2562_020088 [Oryza meyeriana var. granulata]
MASPIHQNLGVFQTAKLLFPRPQETTVSVAGSSTISYVFIRKDGGAVVPPAALTPLHRRVCNFSSLPPHPLAYVNCGARKKRRPPQWIKPPLGPGFPSPPLLVVFMRLFLAGGRPVPLRALNGFDWSEGESVSLHIHEETPPFSVSLPQLVAAAGAATAAVAWAVAAAVAGAAVAAVLKAAAAVVVGAAAAAVPGAAAAVAGAVAAVAACLLCYC